MSFDLTVFCQVRSHSHRLDEKAFVGLKDERCGINAYDITDSTFFLGIHSRNLPVMSPQQFSAYASYTLSYFLMALNISSLGHFDWAAKTESINSYSLFDNHGQTAAGIASVNDYKYPSENRKEFHSGYVFKASQVLTALSEENDPSVRTEYLKGIFHLGYTFFDLQFRKEAFANFYRCLEYFVTSRILKKKRLSNELQDFKAAFSRMDLSEDIQEMFCKDLYPLRSSQVMHSQRQQNEIEWEDALRMKLMADVAMHEYYRPIWENNKS